MDKTLLRRILKGKVTRISKTVLKTEKKIRWKK